MIWVFLGGGGFAAKTRLTGYWISLDFLGFSRPNRVFSMGYARFSPTKVSRGLFPQGRGANGRPRAWACGSAGLFMRGNISCFWFSARDCRPDLSRFGRLNPEAARSAAWRLKAGSRMRGPHPQPSPVPRRSPDEVRDQVRGRDERRGG